MRSRDIFVADSSSHNAFLIVSASEQRYALPLADIAEIMRPLPLQKIGASITGVLGVSRIRGNVVPVIGLANLISQAAPEPARFVSMRSRRRKFALAVDSVIGVYELETTNAQELPALVQAVPGIQKAAELNHELVFYIEPIHLVPEAVWEQVRTKRPH